MFEKRLYHHLDWGLLAAVLVLCVIGLSQIYSATGGWTPIVETQIYGILLGLVALTVCLSVDYRSLADKSHFIYLAIIVVLVYVLFFGDVRGGARRWIDFGTFNLQPSEFAKLALALVLAKFVGETRRGGVSRMDLVVVAVLTAVPVIIIGRQPDLGSAALLIPVASTVAFAAGHHWHKAQQPHWFRAQNPHLVWKHRWPQ